MKRGGPFPDGLEQQEARLLGPYPTWERWRPTIENRFNISFTNSHRPVETLLHEFYCMRRLHQKTRKIDKGEVMAFWERVAEQLPDFEEQYGEIIEFIVGKTPVQPRK